ncbi:class I SAM-dependent methyltransferase [Algiphilus aromaticivorans]|jgi:O-methyltransferase involved in polyketide biosynthesis|uniref:class I SAM-dependent methyltransferase n=1 Tax=Algiphilus aromaticivorans TaxID=382454 RepID=UPI00069385E5|nr:class I SAM-dependent methyltransferase [Algiphilus aromaticivorans]
MPFSGFTRVSPTARFTGAVWRRYGLSPAVLHPRSERLLAGALRLGAPLGRRLPLEGMLRARHCAIDAWLAEAVAVGRVTQVIELAAGHSARGWRMKQRFGEALHYIETDLPAMAHTKRRLLADAGMLGAGHDVRALDATRHEGAQSLAGLLAERDRSQGIALISEGLLNYLPAGAVERLWQEAARSMAGFADSLYLADVYLPTDNADWPTRGFIGGLSLAVRGAVRLHFRDAADTLEQARRCGWRSASLQQPSEAGLTPTIGHAVGAQRVRILHASAHGAT